MATNLIIVIFFGLASAIVVSILAKLLSDATLSRSKINLRISDELATVKDIVAYDPEKIIEKILELQQFPQVFLSYSKTDDLFAFQFAHYLRLNGINVWTEREQIKIGDSIENKIQEGISTSQWVLFLISESSLHSTWIEQQLSWALDHEHLLKRSYIVPVLLEPVELPSRLLDRSYVDLSNNYKIELQKLVQHLTSQTSSSIDDTMSRFLRIRVKQAPEITFQHDNIIRTKAIYNISTHGGDEDPVINIGLPQTLHYLEATES